MPPQDDPELFNSSDQEYEEPANPYAKYGEKSLVQMFESRFDDRLKSKKRLRELQDVRGAPGTIARRNLWMNRLMGYCTINNIPIDPALGPTGDTLVRFVETIVGHMKLWPGKEAPQQMTVKVALHTVITALEFQYSSYKLSRHDAGRLDSTLASLSREGKLSRGYWRKKEWVGISICEKMVRSWFMAGLQQGTPSWDRHLGKALSIVLMCALGCRSGDLTLSNLYKKEFVCYEDVSIKLRGGGKTVDDLEAEVLLRYQKGFKDITNDDRTVYLTSLQGSQYNIICPVKLLLIQALRAGNIVECNSLQDVLERTSRRFDQTVQWKDKQLPILPAFTSKGPCGFDYDRPARCEQLNHTLKEMSLVGGILARLICHDIRRGVAKDVANSTHHIRGVADSAVRASLGHSTKSGPVTDGYVGNIEESVYAQRVDQMYQSKAAPLVGMGMPLKKMKLSRKTIDDYLKKNDIEENPDVSHYLVRQKASRQIRKTEVTEWMETERSRDMLEPVREKVLAARTSSQINARGSEEDTAKSSREVGVLQSIDPTLLEMSSEKSLQELEASEDSQLMTPGEFDMIEEIICDDNPQGIRDDIEEISLGLLFHNMDLSDKALDVLKLPAHRFVDAFASINIVRSGGAQVYAEKDLAAKLPLHVANGNSRDPPTRYMYCCPKCAKPCATITLRDDHLLICKGIPAERPFKCEKGCVDKSFKNDNDREKHYRDYHNFQERVCEFSGCPEPEKVFKTMASYQGHLVSQHDPISPRPCPYPGCSCKTTFTQRSALFHHMRSAHKLMTVASQKQYSVPPRNAPKPGKTWIPRKCPIGGFEKCDQMFTTSAVMIRHLRAPTLHDKILDEARSISMSTATRKTDEDEDEDEDEDGDE